jgi:hypothetical protein
MAVRRKNQGASDWSWRMAGVVLCAFFGLGVMAGLGVAGRQTALSVPSRIIEYCNRIWTALSPLNRAALAVPKFAPAQSDAFAVAMVERKDGFYALRSTGELRGPVSAETEDDLPILSGMALEGARPQQLLEDAGALVRAEATLGELISEMSVAADGTASLYLEKSRTELSFDLAKATPELERAAYLLRRWRERRDLVAALDMTTPDLAVMRLRAAAPVASDGAAMVEAAAHRGFAPTAVRAGGPRTRELAAR